MWYNFLDYRQSKKKYCGNHSFYNVVTIKCVNLTDPYVCQRQASVSRKWGHWLEPCVSRPCKIWKQVRGYSPAYLGREFSGLTCWRTLDSESRKTSVRWFEHVADGLGIVSVRSALTGDAAVEIMLAFRRGSGLDVCAQETWSFSPG